MKSFLVNITIQPKKPEDFVFALLSIAHPLEITVATNRIGDNQFLIRATGSEIDLQRFVYVLQEHSGEWKLMDVIFKTKRWTDFIPFFGM